MRIHVTRAEIDDIKSKMVSGQMVHQKVSTRNNELSYQLVKHILRKAKGRGLSRPVKWGEFKEFDDGSFEFEVLSG